MRRLFALLLICSMTVGVLILYTGQTGQAQSSRPPCNNNSSECMISAATTYIDALVSHKATQLALVLAPNVVRTEEGTNTGTGAAAIITSVSLPTPDESIIDARNIRWFVDKPDHEAIAFYLLDVGAEPSPLLPFVRPTVATGTVHLSERFQVKNGLISQIEAIFSVSTVPNQGSGWGW
jgi:hypothetical protein